MRVAAAAALMLLAGGCFLPDVGVGRCDLATGSACRPGFFCSPDGGCSAEPCSPGATVACALPNSDYGEHVCGDAGWSTCAPSPRSACANGLGVCAGAVRRFDDLPGCTGLSFDRGDAGYQAVETCPGDGRDNDCDGYVDEVSDDPAQLACGRGICLADAGGRLRVYRRCGETVCPQARIASAISGWRPLDTCDGLDLDCSGLADVGPEITIAADSDEVALLRDTTNADAGWQIAVSGRAPDGGFGLASFQLTPAVTPLKAPKWLGVRATPGAFVPSYTPGAILSTLAWRDGPTRIAAARVFDSDVFPVKLTVTPELRVVRGPFVAEYDGKALMTAAFELPDGGVVESLHTGLLPITTAAPDTWTPDCAAGPGRQECFFGPNYRVQVWGNATQTGLGFLADGANASLVVLRRDAGNPGSDINFEPNAVFLADQGSSFTLGGTGEDKVLAYVFPSRDYQFIVMRQRVDAGFLVGTTKLNDFPESTALEVAPRADGGIIPILAYRSGSTLSVLAGLEGGAGTALSLGASGRPAVAWSPALPGYALVASAQAGPDGGTDVVGRLVCLPK